MSVTSPKASSKSFDEIRRAAEALVPIIEADAEFAERENRLSDRVVQGFRDAGIYGMLVPKVLGGSEVTMVQAIEVVERLSYADPSTGWFGAVLGVTAGTTGPFISEAGAQAIYANGPDVAIPSSGTPRGMARRVDGGYVCFGSWGYASGIMHGDWVGARCMVVEDGKPKIGPHGAPIFFMGYAPRDAVEVQGNWETLGLSGTGSFDFTFVGGERFISDDFIIMDGTQPKRGGVQYAVGIAGFATWGHTAWATGVGRRFLDELRKVANEKRDVFGLIGDSPMFQKSFAEAEGNYRSARAFVYEAWNDIDRSNARGDAATNAQIALVRLAMRRMHDADSEIATWGHKAARGASLRGGPLQRLYRDIHSGTQHLTLADEIERDCGRVLLGRDEGTFWTLVGLR